jgi:large subunit ribosomal protein L3
MVTTPLGKKLSMTQVWDSEGNVVPVTLIQAGPCTVVQVKSKDGKDGYDAVQLAFGQLERKNGGKGDFRADKPTLGHFQKHGGLAPHQLVREIRLSDGKGAPQTGAVLNVEMFQNGQRVDVIGTTKGRGFQGCIKRHKFNAGPRSHGSKNYREPGAIGNNSTPGHVIKGKRMPGHMGDARRTVRNLEVIKVEPEQNLLYVRGSIPGPQGGTVLVRKAKGS